MSTLVGQGNQYLICGYLSERTWDQVTEINNGLYNSGVISSNLTYTVNTVTVNSFHGFVTVSNDTTKNVKVRTTTAFTLSVTGPPYPTHLVVGYTHYNIEDNSAIFSLTTTPGTHDVIIAQLTYDGSNNVIGLTYTNQDIASVAIPGLGGITGNNLDVLQYSTATSDWETVPVRNLIYGYGTEVSGNKINWDGTRWAVDTLWYTAAVNPAGTGRLNYNGYLYATKVYGATYNDFADFMKLPEDEPVEFGKVYYRNKSGELRRTVEYNQKGIVGIASNTYGSSVGHIDKTHQVPLAVAGFVLAYVDDIYEPGTPLTSSADGYLTKMENDDKIAYPERIVATFDREETELGWNDVAVNGRHWVKVM